MSFILKTTKTPPCYCNSKPSVRYSDTNPYYVHPTIWQCDTCGKYWELDIDQCLGLELRRWRAVSFQRVVRLVRTTAKKDGKSMSKAQAQDFVLKSKEAQ